MFRQNQLVIDLDAIRHNYLLMKSQVPPEVRVMAVVKANAYGHGILEVAHTVVDAGCNDLAVAIPEEGVLLRDNGIQANILVLGAATEVAADVAVERDLTLTVFEPDMVAVLEEAAARIGKPALVNIKLDTGMNRIGLRTEGEADALAIALSEAKNVRVTAIYTHFADADNLTDAGAISAYTQQQLQKFQTLRAHFDASIPVHVSNSAMGLVAPEANFSMIRQGISLYGYPPVPTDLDFRPALRWETEIVYVKELCAGCSIGYGCTYTTDHTMRIATVAVGYGDGYHRVMSNRGQMLVNGKRANIVGRICMDQTMIDVTGIPDVQEGTQAVLIGAQGNDRIGADELAVWAETISYEVLLAITARVPRTYLPAQATLPDHQAQ
ncbi:MAG TPA: alanine racemase [Candidatus Limiplasma sp.]|nr:alanine racemase [Candidatus Limiplasma sp.]HPS81754.1 alanine racemase [Candidatus Limiplasma sp.]